MTLLLSHVVEDAPTVTFRLFRVLRSWDNSIYASYRQRVSNPASLRYGDNSTNASTFALLGLGESH
jgi:hypothetical protein